MTHLQLVDMAHKEADLLQNYIRIVHELYGRIRNCTLI